MEKHILINNLWSRIYLPENEIKEIVIGVHGFAGDKESSVLILLANELHKQNKALLSFDLPCHGENDKSQLLKLSDCIDSIKIIFDYVKENFKNIPISVFATSFGGYLTLHYLSQNPENLHKLILRAPAIYMGKILENVILPEHGFSTEDLKNTLNLGYANPLLVNDKFLKDLKDTTLETTQTTGHFLYILQGKQDDVVNPDDNDRFFKKFYPNQHKFIYFENADHRFKKPGELEKIIADSLSILNDEEI